MLDGRLVLSWHSASCSRSSLTLCSLYPHLCTSEWYPVILVQMKSHLLEFFFKPLASNQSHVICTGLGLCLCSPWDLSSPVSYRKHLSMYFPTVGWFPYNQKVLYCFRNSLYFHKTFKQRDSHTHTHTNMHLNVYPRMCLDGWRRSSVGGILLAQHAHNPGWKQAQNAGGSGGRMSSSRSSSPAVSLRIIRVCLK